MASRKEHLEHAEQLAERAERSEGVTASKYSAEAQTRAMLAEARRSDRPVYGTTRIQRERR